MDFTIYWLLTILSTSLVAPIYLPGCYLWKIFDKDNQKDGGLYTDSQTDNKNLETAYA